MPDMNNQTLETQLSMANAEAGRLRKCLEFWLEYADHERLSINLVDDTRNVLERPRSLLGDVLERLAEDQERSAVEMMIRGQA